MKPQKWQTPETIVSLLTDFTGDVDWLTAETTIPEISLLAACPQDPDHHGEGDVAEHTRRVLSCLNKSAPVSATMVLAGLFHDIAKPMCTRVEDGRLRAPGHARKGAVLSRNVLYKMNLHPVAREQICELVAAHIKPFHMFDREDSLKETIRLSHSLSIENLVALAKADGCGRESDSKDQLLDAVGLFEEWAKEHNVLTQPFQHDGRAKVRYLLQEQTDPTYSPWPTETSRMWVMSGLPGSGKDTWIENNLPDVADVSLDNIRKQLKIAPTAPQGHVIAEAREQTKQLLRKHKDVVWNATNISRSTRDKIVRLGLNYGAHVTIVAVETPHQTALWRNNQRKNPVPEKAIEKMMAKWETPTQAEAHELLVVDGTTGETLAE